MTVADLLLRATIAAYVTGVVAALVTSRPIGRFLGAAGAALGSAAALALGGAILAGARAPQLIVSSFAFTPLIFRPDALGAFFLVTVGIVGVAAGVYGFGYSGGLHGGSVKAMGAGINVLLLTLALQVMADNPLTFLFVWEAMSLAACLLILAEPDQRGAVAAANWYLGVMHVGFAALVAMFFLLSGGQLVASFADLRAVSLPGGVRDAVFVLALAGFGSKAGIIPLHVWLPRAHPVAPSHGSALMSGVVLKMGVYGIVRVTFDLIPGGAAWWGMVVLALGTLSALLGVLYALMQHDLKRLLAYHSIENVGIIFMGIGAALLCRSYGLSGVAALALVAALFHTINHACFKGLLFLCAGAVVRATGTRNIEHLGGLIRRMPQTAFAFLIGSAAISALPPLNGFASEWLFQSLLGGANVRSSAVAILMPIAVGLLALTSGLAAVCFVKAFGITFLAIPRSPAAGAAVEAPRSMRVAMTMLVLACVALGLGPFLVVPAIGRILAPLPGLAAAAELRTSRGFIAGMPQGLGTMSAPAVAFALMTLMLLVLVLLRVFASRLRIRRAETWGCGRLVQTPRMQYTATAFAEPLKRVFAELYRPTEDLTVDVHPDSKYFIRRITYESRIGPLLERLVYEPIVAAVHRVAGAARSVQAGSVHLYLLYMCAALVALLLAARWLP